MNKLTWMDCNKDKEAKTFSSDTISLYLYKFLQTVFFFLRKVKTAFEKKERRIEALA